MQEPNLKSVAERETYRILIGGGGTGGHVFPAIAIADAIKGLVPACEFQFVGARGKLEMEKVPAAGYAIEGLPVAGFQRKMTLKNITFFFKLAASMRLSRRIVRRFRPHLAIGVGGYASGPILKAAARRGIPLLIQEQNSYAGVTNRLLARSARTICVAYEGMDRYFPKEKLVLTGNPIRQHLLQKRSNPAADRREFGLSQEGLSCLVVGGSLGARTLNKSLMAGIEQLKKSDIQLIWQCGKHYHEEVKAFLEKHPAHHLKLHPFITNMGAAYGIADVVVSRAGALSISELCALGKATILVPSPNVAEDHQTSNARALESKGAAVMVADKEAEAVLVERLLELSKDADKRKQLSENIARMALPDAAERIATEALKILNDQ